MLKITSIPAQHRNAPALFLIPGGPGLSSLTLRSLEPLSRSFDLHFVDLPGTNGLAYDKDHTFDELSAALAGRVDSLGRTAFLLGHSFGGFFASSAALRSKHAAGIICIATPFSAASLEAVGRNYGEGTTPSLADAEVRWTEQPSDSTMAAWVAEYSLLYFTEARAGQGREMLLKDPMSHMLFKSLRGSASEMSKLLPMLRTWDRTKAFLAGADDRLLPPPILENDAQQGRFSFHVVPKASHFAMFDQPEVVAGLIENVLATRKDPL